jgi:hypothetical protein
MKYGCPENKMKKFLPGLLITFGVLLFFMRGQSAVNTRIRLKDSLKSEQLVIVVSDNWTSIRSMVYCFEKAERQMAAPVFISSCYR